MSRILMVSPHPTYSPRGTPISVVNRCRALSALGHDIDLVTYGIGENVPIRGLRYLRAPVPGIRSVRVGPSLKKLPLDLAVFLCTLLVLLRHPRRYDVLHTHEEAGLLGALLAPLFGLRHVYDMGNDLDVVLENYGLGQRHPLRRVARWVEDATIRSADAVFVHFPSLAARVAKAAEVPPPCQVVFNIGLANPAKPEEIVAARSSWPIQDAPVAAYIGTFEAYQGLPMLVTALAETQSGVHLLLAGGSAAQQQSLAEVAASAGVSERVHLLGRLEPDDVPATLAAADVLVSPRASGSNTPLKIFEYLQSGRPIVATAIESHLAVLDQEIAILTEPTVSAIARGIDRAVSGDVSIKAMTRAAKARVDARYTPDAYLDGVAEGYAHLRLTPAGRGETTAQLAAVQ